MPKKHFDAINHIVHLTAARINKYLRSCSFATSCAKTTACVISRNGSRPPYNEAADLSNLSATDIDNMCECMHFLFHLIKKHGVAYEDSVKVYDKQGQCVFDSGEYNK